MKRNPNTLKKRVRQRHKDLNKGFLVQFAKEASTIPAYAMRELTGKRHDQKPKGTLKKGWFE